MNVYEINLDGLVGATHHYAGLAPGNLASIKNAGTLANPLAAIKQGIDKMRFLMQTGVKQALFPPQQRPNLQLLKRLGFTGSTAQLLNKARHEAPELLSACYSASSMWAANTATLSPSADANDKRIHFTPANLVSNLHRHQETAFSAKLLKTIFNNHTHFQHHPSLPPSVITGDEGAANHNRICKTHAEHGIHLFVYGKHGLQPGGMKPQIHPARQTLEASAAIARAHRLNLERVFFVQQNPLAIDQGVFHNDVICVCNENVMFLHAQAFVNQERVLNHLRQAAPFPLTIIEAQESDFSVQEAVNSYLFNSQLVTLADGSMLLIAPSECEENPKILDFIHRVLKDDNNPIKKLHFFNLRQSMRNGGGPACLRLRVVLNEQELNAMHQGVLVTDPLLVTLEQWAEKYYRAELCVDDLSDLLFIDEVMRGLDELTQILKLGSIYPFQAV